MTQAARAIPFIKASACGNDFLLIEELAAKQVAPQLDLSNFTRRICDRHEGVGADGVEWMRPHSSAELEIRLINSDGSDAEISGNGTRCVAAYLCAEFGKERITLQTGAGLKTCTFIGKTDETYEFETDMGEAVVEPELTLDLGIRQIRGVPVSMGNPHYVAFVSEFEPKWQALAAEEIQNNARFKAGVNVEFAVAGGNNELQARFFERGAGETQSSGTGSCASAAAAIATGRAVSPVTVQALGGKQVVRQQGSRIYLRGPARLVCRGEYFVT
ncbi:MAG TPA: diaminopimelate epimerase [Candidatus Sulfotelmatobacter sp.]|nr:diaminopimelate epimerase [Candidatus Sulfotelmatobacter sp.]